MEDYRRLLHFPPVTSPNLFPRKSSFLPVSAMKDRRILAAVFLLPALGASYMTWVMWRAGDSGKWLFGVFALFFLLLTVAPFVPEFKRKPEPPPTTRFVPHWFMLLGILAVIAVVALAVVNAIL